MAYHLGRYNKGNDHPRMATRTSLDQGVHKTVAWHVEHRELVQQINRPIRITLRKPTAQWQKTFPTKEVPILCDLEKGGTNGEPFSLYVSFPSSPHAVSSLCCLFFFCFPPPRRCR
jgi:hypothetical protein